MTIETRPDRRVKRTRALLRDALIDLIQQKGYDQISVQDITEQANVNRATFYLHYKDKQELLLQSMQEVYDDLLARIIEMESDMVQRENLEAEKSVLQHIKDYYGFYRVMLSENGAPAFMVHMLDAMAKAQLKLCQPMREHTTTPPLPYDITVHYYAGASIGLLRWWVLNGLPYSIDEMARMWHDLDMHGIPWAVGIEGA